MQVTATVAFNGPRSTCHVKWLINNAMYGFASVLIHIVCSRSGLQAWCYKSSFIGAEILIMEGFSDEVVDWSLKKQMEPWMIRCLFIIIDSNRYSLQLVVFIQVYEAICVFVLLFFFSVLTELHFLILTGERTACQPDVILNMSSHCCMFLIMFYFLLYIFPPTGIFHEKASICANTLTDQMRLKSN